MKDLSGSDARVRELVSSATDFALEVSRQIEKKFGDLSDEDGEVFMGTFLSVMASSTYGLIFRNHGEEAADRWLELFLGAFSEAIQGLGLRRCFAFARDPIVLDPRSGPSGPSSPKP